MINSGGHRVKQALDLDPTFGTGGRVVTDIGVFERAADVVTQADGKIVMAATKPAEGGATTSDVALFRYNVDGSLDTSFGINGVALIDINGRGDVAEAVAMQSDGKIVVAGAALLFPEPSQFAVIRDKANGSIDAAFGTSGRVLRRLALRGRLRHGHPCRRGGSSSRDTPAGDRPKWPLRDTTRTARSTSRSTATAR